MGLDHPPTSPPPTGCCIPSGCWPPAVAVCVCVCVCVCAEPYKGLRLKGVLYPPAPRPPPIQWMTVSQAASLRPPQRPPTALQPPARPLQPPPSRQQPPLPPPLETPFRLPPLSNATPALPHSACAPGGADYAPPVLLNICFRLPFALLFWSKKWGAGACTSRGAGASEVLCEGSAVTLALALVLAFALLSSRCRRRAQVQLRGRADDDEEEEEWEDDAVMSAADIERYVPGLPLSRRQAHSSQSCPNMIVSHTGPSAVIRAGSVKF